MAQRMSNTSGRDVDDAPSGARPAMTPSQWLALITAITFVGVGVVGFFITGFSDFAAHDTMKHLLIFEINPMHNLVHLALGLVGLALFNRVRGALLYGIIVAAGYAGALVYGLFALGQDWDILSLNAEDNWLHLGLAVLGLAVAALAASELATASKVDADRSTAVRGSGTRPRHA